MQELRILVERNSLLPVLYGNLSHADLQRHLRQSQSADADSAAWRRFTDAVEGITYVRSTEEYTGACQPCCMLPPAVCRLDQRQCKKL
jgi:hypothetical protein